MYGSEQITFDFEQYSKIIIDYIILFFNKLCIWQITWYEID